jgi:hypothetical protein
MSRWHFIETKMLKKGLQSFYNCDKFLSVMAMNGKIASLRFSEIGGLWL